MALRLYSSLGRETREFRPLIPGHVRIYVCGVTPYDVTHLGHAFSYVQFDAMRRYFEWNGLRVTYVQNVTDVDDDMIMVSKRQGGRPIAEIRDENDAILRADLDRLNVLRPSAYPFASDYIPQMQDAIAEIIKAGRAYAVEGDIFFEAATFPGYGTLSGVGIAELAKRENPESKREEKKRGPLDFLLWQQTEAGEPTWDSPWGPGRPGWSIECTAMSIAHLGDQIDVHGGGRDLIFPHHENEIAQAETVTGCAPFCTTWAHNGMLQLDGVKMSKSLGNLVLARVLMQHHDPDLLRLYLLSTHYRADGNYTQGDLEALRPRFERLRAASAAEASVEQPGQLTAAFRQAMDNDLDVPAALDVLSEGATRVLNSDAAQAGELRELLAVLGFDFARAPGPANGDFSPDAARGLTKA